MRDTACTAAASIATVYAPRRLPPASCLLPPASCLLPPASCLLPPHTHVHTRGGLAGRADALPNKAGGEADAFILQMRVAQRRLPGRKVNRREPPSGARFDP